jgi:3-hydroxyisobutyrate dehydrogenase
MRVAFVGLGNMGALMSRNILAAGHDVVVHDVRTAAAAGLLADGARWAASPAAAGAAREVAITMLPAPRHVEQVLLGPDGLLAGLPPGAVWVDMSTSVPAVADRVRELAGPRGIDVLDARSAAWPAGAGGHAADLRRR